MFTDKNKVFKCISMFGLLLILGLFVLNNYSYAEPLDVSPRAIDCGYCGQHVFETIDKKFVRTDDAGSRCTNCSRQSSHKTDVYSCRRVQMCSNECTYRILEYLPAEYRCY